MKLPGPDHPITVTPNPQRVRVEANGHVIADSIAAVTLQEASYPAVQYIPRADIEMGFFGRTDRQTNCPYKGDAHYFTLTIDGEVLESVAWSYEAPYPAMTAIQGMLAFYPDRVRVYAVDPGV